MGKLPLTQNQVLRQVKRLKEVIFDNYLENKDETYEGEINNEVLIIIQKQIIPDDEITETQFLKMITSGTTELIEFLENKVKSVDERVIHFFAFDFMTQSINFMYKSEVSEIDKYYNPMYN